MAEVRKPPTCLIVLGMAGSGKTSLVSRLSKSEKTPFIVNLDPACLGTPYHSDIDIRDTINYKNVMEKYKLGPNGAIVTCLNLFTTKFEEVVKAISNCPNEICLIDTPGQIEVFTWSISGQMITKNLAQNFPTVVFYVMDTVRCTAPTTFMSNMLYACSTLYKYLVPFIAIMNKTDIVSHSYAKEWISDIDSFLQTLSDEDDYMSNLNRALALTLDKFYEELKFCGFSAQNGDGVEDLYKLIDDAREEYEQTYKAEYQQMKSDAEEHEKLNDEKMENDVYIRHPANESSSDSEGEEEAYDDARRIADDETFAKVVEQHQKRTMERAKKAELNNAPETSCSKDI